VLGELLSLSNIEKYFSDGSRCETITTGGVVEVGGTVDEGEIGDVGGIGDEVGRVVGSFFLGDWGEKRVIGDKGVLGVGSLLVFGLVEWYGLEWGGGLE
jgi:hypothetical protein